MPARGGSPARLGIGADLVHRVQALGWISDGEANPDYLHLLKAVRSGPDPDGALHRLASLAERHPRVHILDHAESLVALAGGSRALWEALVRHPEWLDGPIAEPSTAAARVHQEMIPIAVDDLVGRADFVTTTTALSDLGDRIAGWALGRARAQLADRRPEVENLPLVVIAMGKWGGRELNYASDIDLLFVYEPGPLQPEPARDLANRLASRFVDVISAPGPEGLGFRVDAELRPEGGTGPLARSLEAYRSYYQKWGEAWEFQSLLKARPAAGDLELGARFMAMTNEFVWPQSLNPEAVRSLRHLKSRAEEDADPADVKRSPGGIRDVEFSVQLLQLIHGRHDDQLRVPGTLAALDALVEGGYVKSDDAAALADSYQWLRRVEHRLQLWNLSQTHRIPADRPGREWLAKAMGYRDRTHELALDRFETELQDHRTKVRNLHERLYYRPLLEAFAAAPSGQFTRLDAAERLQALGYQDVPAAARAFNDLTSGLSRRSRLMEQLLPLMLEWLADSPNPDLGLEQLRLLVTSSSEAQDLVGTLRDRPLAAQRLCQLLGTSRLLGRYIDRMPEFLPTLASDGDLRNLAGGQGLINSAVERIELRDDRHARVLALGRFVRRRRLRIATADLLDLRSLEETTGSLTDTADAAAGAAMRIAQLEVGSEVLAVIAMGSWGGAELGYGSDLDLLYVYRRGEDRPAAHRLASEFGAALGQPTGEHFAYRVDARLRPEGKQGPLARSLDAYGRYYQQWAEPWEQMALTKARAITGDWSAAEELVAAAHQVIYRSTLAIDAVRAIRRMKARIESERIPPGEDPDFHLKLGRGGLTDIEFLTQLLQLRYGHRHPEVTVGNTLAALETLSGVGALSDEQLSILTGAHNFCTRVRNRLFLQMGRQVDALPAVPAEASRLAQSLGFPNRGVLREEYRRLTRRARRVFEKLFYED